MLLLTEVLVPNMYYVAYVVINYNTLGCMCIGVNDYIVSSMFLVFVAGYSTWYLLLCIHSNICIYVHVCMYVCMYVMDGRSM